MSEQCVHHVLDVRPHRVMGTGAVAFFETGQDAVMIVQPAAAIGEIHDATVQASPHGAAIALLPEPVDGIFQQRVLTGARNQQMKGSVGLVGALLSS